MSTGSGGAARYVVAAASEVGSAKAILPVAVHLAAVGVEVTAQVPAVAIEVLHRWWDELPGCLRIIALDLRGWSESSLEIHPPGAVLVGTTVADSAERQLTLLARSQEIRTVAVLDERYGYRRRFSDEIGQLRYLPDVITLMDGQCVDQAVAEGLPPSILFVSGSPILSYLARNAERLRRNQQRFIGRPGAARKCVLFVSETFARDNGACPGSQGRLGTFLGFTEETVRRDILWALEAIGRDVVLIERLHPSDDTAPEQARVTGRLFWEQTQEGDLWEHLLQADAVIGMKSMALLEAALLGCRVASYQPNLIGENRSAAVNFGIADRVISREQLKDWLETALSANASWIPPPAGLPFIQPDAADRVADLVLGVR